MRKEGIKLPDNALDDLWVNVEHGYKKVTIIIPFNDVKIARWCYERLTKGSEDQ